METNNLIKLLAQVVIEARHENNTQVEILTYRILYNLSAGNADQAIADALMADTLIAASALIADCKPRRNNKKND